MRPRPGDVFELATSKGYAYIQCCLKHPRYTYLIRILPGMYETQPSSLKDLATRREAFFVFFPLGAAARRGIVRWVTNEALPKWAQKQPLMRLEGGSAPGGKVLNWRLWDGGTKETLVQKLTDDQKKVSIAEIWNDTLLIERICQGWKPEVDV